MEGRERRCNEEERGDVESPTGHSSSAGERGTVSTWMNGEVLATVPTSSWLAPRFKFSHCKTLLEANGFKIPIEEFEHPLHIALDHPSVRRYLLFNSSIFNFIMAPLLYLVLWFALYSSLHMYLEGSTTNFWVLCMCVSLVSIIITTIIILIFHNSNKKINMNIDVRLVGVNERMVRHRLLLGVADWVHKCKGKLQLFFVSWDLSPCLRSLTEALEDRSIVRYQVQNRIKKRMSHLILVTEVTTLDSEDGLVEDEEGPDEVRPLLVGGRERSASTSQREDSKLTKNFSLMPDPTLSYQAMAEQLLMTYSALYVRLLVSNRLPASSQCPLGAGKNHSTGSLCLCEYVGSKVLQ
ncbi:transmembrane protein 268-like isoform X1 [Xyrauchen texanus]|uniref:transmembrane protein 268-like isoform X1 n=2 Tax=Xyrauchen texanus TaxID=154827 RepID=UPI002241B87E|nr:transmembrane protein 268-like isoform X1 [Xyrauchen texanus]XP_051949557.1 transmembrane protein 268-like isoform X1 [Xyrauchen texanus]